MKTEELQQVLPSPDVSLTANRTAHQENTDERQGAAREAEPLSVKAIRTAVPGGVRHKEANRRIDYQDRQQKQSATDPGNDAIVHPLSITTRGFANQSRFAAMSRRRRRIMNVM